MDRRDNCNHRGNYSDQFHIDYLLCLGLDANFFRTFTLDCPSFISECGLGGAFNKLPSTRLNSGSLVGSELVMAQFFALKTLGPMLAALLDIKSLPI